MNRRNARLKTMTSLQATILMSLLLCLSLSPEGDATFSDWPMYMRTPDNMGLTVGIGVFSDPQVQWETNLTDYYPNGISFIHAIIPIDLDEDGILDILTSFKTLFSNQVGDGKQVLAGINGLDGTIKWMTEIRNTSYGWESPVVGDVDGDGGLEIIIAYGQRLSSITALDGSLEWSIDMDPIEKREWIDAIEPILLWNRTTLRHDIIYIDPPGNISKIDGDSGRIVKRTALRESIGDTVVIRSPMLGYRSIQNGEINILISGRSGHAGAMWVLDSNLEIIWWQWFDSFYPLGIPAIDIGVHGFPRIIFNSWEYLDHENHIVVLDGLNGHELWNQSLNYSPLASEGAMVIIYDTDFDGETEYILMNSPLDILYVFDRNGTLEWSIEVMINELGAVCDIDSDRDAEIMATSSTKVLCVSGTTGKLEWSLDLGDVLDAPIIVCDVDGDGKLELVVGSFHGMVTCLKGNENENFVPLLTVDSPSNGSVVDDWAMVSGSVLDLDDAGENITIEYMLDDGDWRALETGYEFEERLRIDQTAGNRHFLSVRATDGKDISIVVVRELRQEKDDLMELSSVLYTMLIILFVTGAVLFYQYSRHRMKNA